MHWFCLSLLCAFQWRTKSGIDREFKHALILSSIVLRENIIDCRWGICSAANKSLNTGENWYRLILTRSVVVMKDLWVHRPTGQRWIRQSIIKDWSVVHGQIYQSANSSGLNKLSLTGHSGQWLLYSSGTIWSVKICSTNNNQKESVIKNCPGEQVRSPVSSSFGHSHCRSVCAAKMRQSEWIWMSPELSSAELKHFPTF